jgi:hypothetical protein
MVLQYVAFLEDVPMFIDLLVVNALLTNSNGGREICK